MGNNCTCNNENYFEKEQIIVRSKISENENNNNLNNNNNLSFVKHSTISTNNNNNTYSTNNLLKTKRHNINSNLSFEIIKNDPKLFAAFQKIKNYFITIKTKKIYKIIQNDFR